MYRTLTFAAGLVLAFASTAFAKTELEGVALGQYWSGPEWTQDDLKGRVVMFELWGYN